MIFLFGQIWMKRGSIVNRNDKLISEIIIPKVTDFYHNYMIPVIARKCYNLK